MYHRFDTIKLSDNPKLKAWLKIAEPGYRKHSVNVVACDTTTIRQPYWDGGSRDTFSGHKSSGGFVPLTLATAPWPNTPASREVTLSGDLIVVHGGIFCGKPATLTVYCTPAVADRLFGLSVEPTPVSDDGLTA